MRLDKFLKVSRLIKRRPLAKEIAEQNRIKVNGAIAKPSVSVAVNDEIEITFAKKLLTVRVLLIKEHVKKDEAMDLYEIVSEKVISEE